MYPVSAAFRAALVSSHRVVVRADVCDVAGTVLATLPVVSGSVKVDRTAAVRRRADVTIVDADGTLTPASASALLAPFGNELRLYRGLRLSTADELVPLGVFRMERTQIDDAPDGLTITISASDRARRVSRARWIDPHSIAAGTNYPVAIQALIASRVSGLTYSFMTTTGTTPALTFGLDRDNDPWADAQSMASAIGADLYFDPAGVCVLRSEPDPVGQPVDWTYAEGAEATILGLSRSITSDRTYNGVIVTGEGTGVPVAIRAEAWDDDLASPTYYLGGYGRVPYFVTSAMITTQAQADDVAASTLRRILGHNEQVSFGAIVNPAHEAGDVVRITRARAKVAALHVLDSFDVPLSAGDAMDATTRERRVS